MTNDLNDILKPHRDAADEVERGTDEVYGSGGRFAAESFLAGARHALTHPIILRTPKELDALPVGSKVVGAHPMIARIKGRNGHWWNNLVCFTADAMLKQCGPVELIRLPKEDA